MSIWHIEEYKPRATQGSSALEAAYIWQNDRQLPDLEAGFRGVSSDQQPYPLPSYLFLENAARLPQIDPYAWGPQYEHVLVNREDHNEGTKPPMDVKSLRIIPVNIDGVPEGQLPPQMHEEEQMRKKRERDATEFRQNRAQNIQMKRQRKNLEKQLEPIKEEEEIIPEGLFSEQEEKGMKKEEEKESPIQQEFQQFQDRLDLLEMKNEDAKNELKNELEKLKRMPMENERQINAVKGQLNQLIKEIPNFVAQEDQQLKQQVIQQMDQVVQDVNQLEEKMRGISMEQQQMEQQMSQDIQNLAEQISQIHQSVDGLSLPVDINELVNVLNSQGGKIEKLILVQKKLKQALDEMNAQGQSLTSRYQQVQKSLNHVSFTLNQYEKERKVYRIYPSGYNKSNTIVQRSIPTQRVTQATNIAHSDASVVTRSLPPATQTFSANDGFETKEASSSPMELTGTSPKQEKKKKKVKVPPFVQEAGPEAVTLFQQGKIPRQVLQLGNADVIRRIVQEEEISPIKTRSAKK
jgi:hypothetical protein